MLASSPSLTALQTSYSAQTMPETPSSGGAPSLAGRLFRYLANLTALAFMAYFGRFLYRAWHAPQLFPDGDYRKNGYLLLAFGLLMVGIAFGRFRRKKRLAGVLLSLGIGLLALGISDEYILTQVFATSGPGSPLHLTHQRWHRTYVHRNEANYWERSLIPYREPGSSGKVVIAAVGDSFTFGQGVLGEQLRFTNLLEKSLHERLAPNIDVLNFGSGAGDPITETAWIKDSVATVHPKVVAIFYLSNDIRGVGRFVKVAGGRSLTQAEKAGMIASPTFNHLHWNLIGPMAYERAGNAMFMDLLFAYMNEPHLQEHLEDVRKTVRAAKDIGAQPVFVILPFPHMWQGIEEYWQIEIYKKIMAAVTEEGALTLNLASVEKEMTPTEFQIGPMDGHPNAVAHAAIARPLADWFVGNPEACRTIAPADKCPPSSPSGR